MAFFNLDPDAVALHQLAAGLEEDFRNRLPDFDRMTSVRIDSRPLQCNWKYVLDQNECYHCPVLHPNVGFGSRQKTRWINEQHERWSRHISRADPEEIDGSKGVLPEIDDASPLKYETYIWFLWPNLVFLSHRGAANLKLQLAVPTGPERCRFVVDSMCLNDPARCGRHRQHELLLGYRRAAGCRRDGGATARCAFPRLHPGAPDGRSGTWRAQRARGPSFRRSGVAGAARTRLRITQAGEVGCAKRWVVTGPPVAAPGLNRPAVVAGSDEADAFAAVDGNHRPGNPRRFGRRQVGDQCGAV